MLSRRPLRLLIAALCLFMGTGPALAASSSRRYTNARWGYRIDVPRSLVAQPEPENGGGLAFFSADGRVKLYTYGSFDVDGVQTIAEAQRQAELDWIGGKGRVTYRRAGSNWFVSSGISSGGSIFYQRYEQRTLGDDTTCHVTFTISYPQALRSTWNPQTEAIAKSFRVPSGPCQG